MKKVFSISLLFTALSLPSAAADMKQQDIKNTYMRYCMTNGGVREICECSYNDAGAQLTPLELETVVKTLSAGVPSDQKVMKKLNRAVQVCAKKVEKGELRVQRPVETPAVPAPVPPAAPGSSIVPPPPPPMPGSSTASAVPPLPPVPSVPSAPAAPKTEQSDDINIDIMENPAKEETAPAPKPAKKKKKAAPKKKEQTYFGQYDNQFFDATIRGDISGLRAMAQYMPGVDIKDASGNTPLIASIIYGKDVSMTYLLEKGADVNHKNGKDQNALQLAAYIYRSDMVEKLLAYGAKPDETYGPGFTALMLAVMKQDEASVNSLLKYKAKPNLKMKDGNTALHIASAGKNMAIIGWLVTYGAKVDAQNDMGYTPLMLAAFNGNEQAVQTLLGYKADASIRDKSGRTAAMLAQQAGHFQIAQFLAYR